MTAHLAVFSQNFLSPYGRWMDEDSEALINSFKNKQGSSPNPLPGLFKIHGAQGRSCKAPSIWHHFSVFMKPKGNVHCWRPPATSLENTRELQLGWALCWGPAVPAPSPASVGLRRCSQLPEQGSHTAPRGKRLGKPEESQVAFGKQKHQELHHCSQSFVGMDRAG